MSYEINAIDFNNTKTRVDIDKKDADYCPICHKNVEPIHIASFLNGKETSSRYLQRVYRCPNSHCGMTFLALYRGVPLNLGNPTIAGIFMKELSQDIL